MHKKLFPFTIITIIVFAFLVAVLPAAAQESTPEPTPAPEATPEPPREPICLEFRGSPDDVRIGYYMGEGAAYASTGELSRALFSFTCVITEIDERYIPAYISRAGLLARQRDFEAALADYTRILELDGDSIAAFNNRGIIYMARGEYDEALTDFNRALQLDGEFLIGLNNRAVLYAVRGDYPAAIADLERAIEITGIDDVYAALLNPEIEDPEEYNPGDARPYALLGVIYSNFALDNYRRYLTLDPRGDFRIQSAAGALESRFTFELRLDDGSWLLEARFEEEE